MFTLVNQKGDSNKVYRISRRGKKVTIRFGAMTSTLRELKRTFKTVAEARDFLISKWNEKVDKGYEQVSARALYALRKA